jgi:putative ABC transport system permease protein
MLKNYALTATNNLLKNKLINLINIGGLAIGFAASILIGLYVQNETSYDRHWQNADDIYRVNQQMVYPDEIFETAPTSFKLLPALQQYFPGEVAQGTRIAGMSGEIQIDELHYLEKINLVDKSFTDIFQLDLLAGDIESVMADTNTIALSQSSAKLYFGTESPIGKTITFKSGNNEPEEYRVGAVYTLPEGNTTLDLENFVLLDYARFQNRGNWLTIDCETYVQLSPQVEAGQFDSQLPEFIDLNVSLPPNTAMPGQSPSDFLHFYLQPVSEIYFNPVANPNFPSSISGDKRMVTVFAMIAILVLLVGLANFVILSTAKATQRSREVGVRKVAGASRLQIVLQFMGESLLFTFLALGLAMTLVELILPTFGNLTGKQLSISYGSLSIWSGLTGLFLLVGMIGGIYPAYVLADFKSTSTSRTLQLLNKEAGTGLRGFLIVFQFSISIGLIIATAVVYGQLLFLGKIEPGFNPDNLLVIENMNRREISPFKDVFRQQVQKIPGVTSTAYSSNQANNAGSGSVELGLYRPLGSTGPGFGVTALSVGSEFFQVWQIPLLSGRTFVDGRDPEQRRWFLLAPDELERYRAQENHVILNESATRAFGFASAEAAVGQYIQTADNTGEFRNVLVIGVVADSQFIDLRSRPAPEIYQFFPEVTGFLTIRYQGERDDILKSVEAIWKQQMGDALFVFSFVDQNLGQVFLKERNEGRILSSFALLAITIACLGLFGSAAFTVARRTREIGIRKVFGAEVLQVVRLLLWQFTRPVMLANLIAWPIAIWAMVQWLQRFPYQIELWMLAPICLFSGLIALCIAWVTVGGTAAKAASAKPVLALRYE